MATKKNTRKVIPVEGELYEPSTDTYHVDPQYKTACTGFDFRISKEYEDRILSVQDIRDMLKGIAQNYVFQLEEGQENGYIHYQGRIRLITKTTLAHLKNLFRNKDTKILPNFLRPTLTKEFLKRSFNYQMKEDTRLEGPFTDKDVLDTDDSKQPLAVLSQRYDVLMHLTSEDCLYPYQRRIIESGLLSNRDLRCLDILFDRIGKQGKSTIKDYMDITRKAIIIPPTGDSVRLMEAAYGLIYQRMCETELKPGEVYRPGVIIIDIPRSIRTAELYTFYGVLEQIKSGIAYDFRNKFRTLRVQPPRIWVFTNTLPPEDCLSEDRLRIWTINKDKDIEPYVPEDLTIDNEL